jgi:glycosyltransferase involved in cell wall biosynthesis
VPTDPEISFIMPCYNEQDVIPYTIPHLTAAFAKAGHRLELVACDNGSSDRTGELIHEFIAQGLPVVYHRVEPNEGYGNGVLKSIPVCRAPWIGIIPADGQVDAEDVARLFGAVKTTDPKMIGKVRRRFRMDGPLRKVVSIAYNGFVFTLWPRLGSLDVNGSPKIIPREVLLAMDLRSKQWFLDPEMMVKAHYMGVRVLEMNVFARMRGNGLSHVRGSTCWEFFTKLLSFKFGSALRDWRRALVWPPRETPPAEPRRVPAASGKAD